MQEGKARKLKNPLLRRIRKNLRILINLAVSERLIYLLKTDGEQSKEYQDLYWAHYHSVLKCAMGGACETHIDAVKKGLNSMEQLADSDMIYNNEWNRWICEKCFLERS